MYTCLQPVHVYNRYLGDYIWSSCGHCEACRNKRSHELSERIQREMYNNGNNSALYITLDYDNEHLPIYEKKGFYYESNREDYTKSESDIRFGRINCAEVSEYYRPVNHRKDCFGHLSYPDTDDFFSRFRTVLIRLARSGKLRNVIDNFNEIFYGYGKEDFRFRYFLCGEYGPATFRPHYHAILWFRHRFSDEQLQVLSEIISHCWKNGTAVTEVVLNGGIKHYLSDYVTSFVGLPAVLQGKSVRPFCTFSSRPILGNCELNQEEIQTFLNSGTFRRVKYDDVSKSFVDDPFPSSVYRRYFPKCKGFGYLPHASKLRVYANVYNYFRDRGSFPSLSEFETLRLCDVPFPKRKLLDASAIEDNGSEYIEWSYQDKYASMMCCKYCVMFNTTPEDVMSKIEAIYRNLNYDILRDFYEYQEKHIDELPYTINHDRDFLPSLPKYAEEMELWQYNVLLSYGIDVDELYPDGVMSDDYIDRLYWWNDPNYKSHKELCEVMCQVRIKRKKDNDYKRNLSSNLVKVNYE